MAFHIKYGQWEVPLYANEELTVGRSRAADVRLNDPSVSGRHAAFRIEGERVEVRDLDSRNGVFVDGVKTRGWVKVSDGAEVVIGTQSMRLVRRRDPLEGLSKLAKDATEETHLVDPRARRVHADRDGPTAQLSARERQVLSLIARGYTQREASESLKISVKTIETYVRRIREKTGARSRADFADYARVAGVVFDGPTGPVRAPKDD